MPLPYWVYWGLFILALEHANWGIAEFGGLDLRTHSGFHFQMLAAYGLAALALVGVVVAPLIWRAEAAGWWGLLAVFAVGVGAEVATALHTVALTQARGEPNGEDRRQRKRLS
ncbi:MAG: hypothetical protein L0Z47_01070 [Actinobacteria bacterium]|nr:hypothetical protein [Actinomycetota bacterium]